MKYLAANVSALFDARCSSKVRACMDCSYNGCSSHLPNLICDKSFYTPTTCDNCSDDGSHISKEHSVVRMPINAEI